MIKPLAEYYGPEAVWNCAIEVLGFPATWITTAEEARTLNDRLKKGKER